MPRRTLIFTLLVALLGAIGIPSSGAESEILIPASADAAATDIVNGRVVGTHSVDTGQSVHTVAQVAVEHAVRGELSGQIFVEVPGGKSNLNYDVWVSHQPYFRPGDHVQLALAPTPADEAGTLVAGEPVYSVVNGYEGTAALEGYILSQDQAAGDYVLHGAKIGSFPITYRINPSGSGHSWNPTINAVAAGFQEWEDDAGSDINFTYGGTTSSVASNYSDGVNTVSWVNTSNPADGYLAQAVWVTNHLGQIVGFDIAFNRDFSFSVGAQAGKFDIETVTLHEAGHVLGLGHTYAISEVMYPSITSGTTKGLGAGDRSGVAVLYPSSNPTVGGFNDVSANAYYADAVLWSTSQGIASGTSSTTFSPDQIASRGQVALYLWRFAGSPNPSGSNPFHDISSGSIIEDATTWLYQAGVTTGTSPGYFSPNGSLTRGQIATFLWRMVGEPNYSSYSGFNDVSTSAYYAKPVTWMVANDITTGVSSTMFAPAQQVNRAQLVTFLYRLAGEPAV